MNLQTQCLTQERWIMSIERELLNSIMSYFEKGDVIVREFENSGDVAETLHNAQELLAQFEKNPLIEKHDTFLRSLLENNGEGLKELKAFDSETYNKLKEVFGASELLAHPEQCDKKHT